MSVLEAHGLGIDRDHRTIAQLEELVVERGELVALVGENGVGKSSLLRAVALLEPITAGALTILGEAACAAGAERRRQRAHVTLVLPAPYMFACSVRGNVERGLSARGVDRRQRRDRARTALAGLGIAHLGKRDARTLSTGEAARTALARALVLDTPLLLLDEPFANLDSEGITLAREALLEKTASGVAVVVTALRVADLEGLAPRVVSVARPAAHAPRPHR